MNFRRISALVALFTMGAFVLASCQPTAPTTRTIRFDMTRSGPIVIGSDDNDAPVALTDTPPTIEVGSFVPGCTATITANSLQIIRSGFRAPDDTAYDAWWVTGGSLTAVIPADSDCLPDSEGQTYFLYGHAPTLNNDGAGPNGEADGVAVDQNLAGVPAWAPLFKIVK
jgi:hypothetical protein